MNRAGRLRSGFTLVEAAVALAIAAGALVSLLLARSHAVAQAARAEQRMQAVELADRLMEGLQAEASVGRPYPAVRSGREGLLEWTWEAAAPAPLAVGRSGDPDAAVISTPVVRWTLRITGPRDGRSSTLAEFRMILPTEEAPR